MPTLKEREAGASELIDAIKAEQEELVGERGRYGQAQHLTNWPDIPRDLPSQAEEAIGYLHPDTRITEYCSEGGVGYEVVLYAKDEGGNLLQRREHVEGPETHRQQDEWTQVPTEPLT